MGFLEPEEHAGSWKTAKMSVELGHGPSKLREALRKDSVQTSQVQGRHVAMEMGGIVLI